MKITLADKLVAWLTLFSGLAISAVAEYYSIIGFTAIFAAAVIPVIIMGIVLGVGKIVATVWLKLNWERAPFLVKTYLLTAIAVLMMITSMGIFGFLSKAHMDQTLVSGDATSKIAIYDEKIKTEKENIDAARKALKQMDESVDQVLARSTTEQGADKSAALRRQQAKERAQLQRDISNAQSNIAKLQTERAPIAAEVRKVEAEVGPVKYIAALIYGDNPDNNLLEAAVRWVIIVIVIVFDPLAVILLLASQYSFQWFRKQEEDDLIHETVPLYVADVGEKPTEEEKKSINDFVPQPQEYVPSEEDLIAEANAKLAEIEKEVPETILPEEPKETEIDYSKHTYLNPEKSFWHKPEGWEEVPPQVYRPEPQVVEEEKVETDESKFKILPELQKELEKVEDKIVANVLWTDELQAWREANPNENIYEIQRMFDAGEIDQLPWNDSKKKITYMIKEQGQQILKTRE